MSALPFPVWNKDFLIRLDNTLGRFVALEKYFHLIFDKRMAKVLVELDVSKGLLPEIEIDIGSSLIFQKLDYLNVPSCYSYHHETGHLRNTCASLHHGRPLKNGFSYLHSLPHSPLEVTPLVVSSVSPSPPGPYDTTTIFGDLSDKDLCQIHIF